MNFKQFLESEEKRNVEKLLSILPAGHRKLLQGYKFRYTPGNTLNGDNQHIGYIHKDKIVVAAPWNYSRSFTTLHEIAHLVWEYLMSAKLRKEWSELVARTKKEQMSKFDKKAQKEALKQNDEEVFCMSYAATYSNHAPVIWHNPEWHKFMTEKVAHLVDKESS
jgi:hypothetical protein